MIVVEAVYKQSINDRLIREKFDLPEQTGKLEFYLMDMQEKEAAGTYYSCYTRTVSAKNLSK
jgi:hypothetical protein